ncbi:MAG: NUDIX domain-containing protein [Bacilli bacterium]|nr:NUDIX domain-containing protein [Bacilli bacterium]
MKRHFCASAFVINPIDKKILLVKHHLWDKWVQPGGHMEDGETPEEAAIREVYEETGIKITLLGERFPREDDMIRPLGIQCNRKDNGEKHFDIIYAAVPNNEITDLVISNESYDIGWFSRKELENLSVFPDVKITMDYVLKNYFNVN